VRNCVLSDARQASQSSSLYEAKYIPPTSGSEWNLRSVDLNLLVVRHADGGAQRHPRGRPQWAEPAPAVSKALNRLRWLFDDPLFVLRDRATEPTARAHQLAGPIRGALADISHTLTLPDEFDPATIRATVKIVTNDLHHTSLLPSLIQRLRRHDLQVRANDARACMNNSPPACRATKR